MSERYLRTASVVIISILSWEVISRGPNALLSTAAAQTSPRSASGNNPELEKLFRKDQSDRMPVAGVAIDWTAVTRRDRKREARVKELYKDDRLITGPDYFHAAMILQHSLTTDDYLLAHEFCVVAISKGEDRAKWLAAATEDRFLMNLKRPQRFGTQYKSESLHGAAKLYRVDSVVTDSLRRAMDVPPLAEAKEREAMMNP